MVEVMDSAAMVSKPHRLFGESQGHMTEGDFNAYDAHRLRKVHIYCNGDRFYRGKRVHLNFNRYRNFNDLLNDLTSKLPNTVHLTYGVRQIFTPVTGRKIHDISQLQDGREYVCAGFETFKPLKYSSEVVMESWGVGKPHATIEPFGDSQSSPTTFNTPNAFHPQRHRQLRPKLIRSQKFTKARPDLRINSLTDSYAIPKVITVFRTGATPHSNVKILLNRHGVQSVDQFLKDVSGAFGPKWSKQRLRKLYSLRGREINKVDDFFRADDIFIGVGIDEPSLEEVNEVLGQLYPDSPYAELLLRKWERAKQKRNRQALAKRRYHAYAREAVEPHVALNNRNEGEELPDEDNFVVDYESEEKSESRHKERPGKTSDVNNLNPVKTHVPFDDHFNEKFIEEIIDRTKKTNGLLKIKQRHNKSEQRARNGSDNEIIGRLQNRNEQELNKRHRKSEDTGRNTEKEFEQGRAANEDTDQWDETERDRVKMGINCHENDNEEKSDKEREQKHKGQKNPREPETFKDRENQAHWERENEKERLRQRDVNWKKEKQKIREREKEKWEASQRDVGRQKETELLREQEKEKERELERQLESRKKHQTRLKPLTEQGGNDVFKESLESKRFNLASSSEETSHQNLNEKNNQRPLKEQDSFKNVALVEPVVSPRKIKDGRKFDENSLLQNQEMTAETSIQKQVDSDDFRILSSHSRKNEEVKDKFRKISRKPEDTSGRANASKADKPQPTENNFQHQMKFSGNDAEESSAKADVISSPHKKKHSKQLIQKSKLERQISSTDHVLTKYELGKVLGDGNFAVVKHCRNRLTDEEFAIKVIDKSKLRGKETMIENEIALMKICDHQNIIKLFEEFETNAEIFLVMELVKGGDLFDAITQSVKFSEVDTAKMVFDLAQALYYLHSRSVVHRDLKPENILVYNGTDGERSLKLADFGLAMEVCEPLHTVCGTPTYVAPEILSEIGYGLEIDMWALGVITYILLCGFPPFRSAERKQTELFECIKAGEFEFLLPYWGNSSEDAKALINRLLVVDPKKRYSAVDVLCDPFIVTFAGSQPTPDINVITTNLRRQLDHKARHNRAQFRFQMLKKKA